MSVCPHTCLRWNLSRISRFDTNLTQMSGTSHRSLSMLYCCRRRIFATKALLGNAQYFYILTIEVCRSQWPRGLRRRSTAARLLRLWVQIPPEAWMFYCCECCVLSDRSLCDALITCPEEPYRMWCVVLCDLETSRMRSPWPALGRSATKGTVKFSSTIHITLCIIAFRL